MKKTEYKKMWPAAILTLFAAIWLTSCTVTPKIVRDRQPSFDANVANSGILQRLDNGSWVITAGARARYNSLIALYGKRFTPEIQPDFGVANAGSTFILTSESMVKFGQMSSWHRAEAPH